jgi:hypothetical protein
VVVFGAISPGPAIFVNPAAGVVDERKIVPHSEIATEDHTLFTNPVPNPIEENEIPDAAFASTVSNATCPLSFKKKFGAITVSPGAPPAVAKAGSLSLTTRVIVPVVMSDTKRLFLPAAGCAVNAT